VSLTNASTEVKSLLKRLEAINYDEPYWNESKVIEHVSKQYELLGLEAPKIEIAENWDAARDAAWGAARGAAWDAARDAARGAAWGAAWDAARDAARGAAWGAARDAAWGAARGAAWDAARGAAWDAARDAARGAARDAARGAANTVGALYALPDDPEVQKFVQIEMEMFKALENGLGIYFPMKEKLILAPIPRMIMQGERLHYDHGKAVEWKDGTGYYFLRGVQFEEELYNQIINKELTAEQTLKIGNADQRAAAISMLRPDRLLKMLGAKHINTGIKGTKLYEVKNFMDTGQTEYCMHMKDASSDREFIEWVEPKIGKQGNADLCQANAFGIPLEDYLLMEQEA